MNVSLITSYTRALYAASPIHHRQGQMNIAKIVQTRVSAAGNVDAEGSPSQCCGSASFTRSLTALLRLVLGVACTPNRNAEHSHYLLSDPLQLDILAFHHLWPAMLPCHRY